MCFYNCWEKSRQRVFTTAWQSHMSLLPTTYSPELVIWLWLRSRRLRSSISLHWWMIIVSTRTIRVLSSFILLRPDLSRFYQHHACVATLKSMSILRSQTGHWWDESMPQAYSVMLSHPSIHFLISCQHIKNQNFSHKYLNLELLSRHSEDLAVVYFKKQGRAIWPDLQCSLKSIVTWEKF